MTMLQWLGVCGLLLVGAFIFFALRQGKKVQPDDRPDRGPSVGGGEGNG